MKTMMLWVLTFSAIIHEKKARERLTNEMEELKERLTKAEETIKKFVAVRHALAESVEKLDDRVDVLEGRMGEMVTELQWLRNILDERGITPQG